MASPSLLLLLFFFLFSTFHASLSLSLLLPISKHSLTNQYLTRIHLGSQPESTPLLVDLSSPHLWVVDCSSHTPISSLSIPCSNCALRSVNPISDLSAQGQLVSDSVSLPSQLDDFLFVCAPKFLAQGLAGGALGVFGLGRSSRISPISQFAHQFDLPGRFSICLPGNDKGDGFIFAGKGKSEIYKSLLYTPLLAASPDEYYIGVKSIKISDKKLSLPGPTIRAKLSTVDPLTKMGTRIYEAFLKGFLIAGANLTRVETVRPFGVCYGAGETTGEFPEIDLVLQSEMVSWRFNGRKSMEVGGGVKCLGVLDGGGELGEDEIVIGANHLEEVLMEFDLRNGMFGFSGSLLEKGMRCGELVGFDVAGTSWEL